jgi:hypothetical protein
MASPKKITINPALMDKHAYQVAHLISSFTVPLMRDLYNLFDGDMVEIIVLGEIGTHNVSQFFNKNAGVVPEQWLDDESQRYKFMRPCNALSISDATGIPRETVRRKVNQLIKKGWLYRDANNCLILTAGMGQGFVQTNAQRAVKLMELAAALQALLQAPPTSSD